jgi:hypothetical protein
MNTLDELEAIRARHEEDGPSFRTGMTPDQRQKYTDRATLLRLLDAAREENARREKRDDLARRVLLEKGDAEHFLQLCLMLVMTDAEEAVEIARAALKAPHKGTPMLIDGDERTTVRIFTPYAKDATT